MGFVFGKNVLELEIMGKIYTINPYSEGLTEAVAKLDAQREKYQVIETVTTEHIQELCADMAVFFTSVLGEGAFEELFGEREPNFMDYIELHKHIISQVMAFRAKRIAEFEIAAYQSSAELITKGVVPEQAGQ